METEVLRITAHVFQIDPQTRRQWVPLGGSSPIPIVFYHNQGTNTYRIVASDSGTDVVDSALKANMSFNKTSQKFGQWTDQQANTVYGVGFQHEDHLEDFTETFSLGTNPPAQPAAAVRALAPAQSGAAGKRDSAGADMGNETLTQLKYENERLKIALGTSSTNAKKWEQELQILKNNNARLKTALQESAANVEEWKTQLTAWKEESTRMKAKVRELEAGGGGSSSEVAALQQKVGRAEAERDQLAAQLTKMKSTNAPAREAIGQHQDTIGRIEANLQQGLRELQTVKSSLAAINLH